VAALKVTREQLTGRLASLQESIPGVRAARQGRSAIVAAGAVLALVAVILLSRRSARRGGA